MTVENEFYELIKQMNLSFGEDKKEEDLIKIRNMFSINAYKFQLRNICNKFKDISYGCIRVEDKDEYLFLLDEYVNLDKYRALNIKASEDNNYLYFEAGQVRHKDEMHNIDLQKTDKEIEKCLESLLGKNKDIFYWDGKYYFDIRELKKEKSNNLFYCEGTIGRAKKKYKELNTLIKSIFIKGTQKYKEDIKLEDFKRLERFLMDAIPVCKKDGKLIEINEYVKQRENIRECMRLQIIEYKKRKRLNYAFDKFDNLLFYLSEDKKIDVEKQLLQLEEIEEEAAYFIKNRIVELVSQDIDMMDTLITEYRRAIVLERWKKGILGKYEYNKMNMEEFISQLKEEDKYKQVREMLRNPDKEIKKMFSGYLEEEDYWACYNEVYGRLSK